MPTIVKITDCAIGVGTLLPAADALFGANLVCWLKASTGVTLNSGGLITSVIDQSASAYNFTAHDLGDSIASNAFGTKPGIQLVPGANTITTVNTTAMDFQRHNPFSIGFVSKIGSVAPAPQDCFFGGNMIPQLDGWWIDRGTQLHASASYRLRLCRFWSATTPAEMSIATPTNPVAGDIASYIFTYDGSATAAGMKVYRNGIAQTPVVINDTVNDEFNNNGRNGYLGGYPGNGSSDVIGELAVINRLITPTEAAELHGRWSQDYGL